MSPRLLPVFTALAAIACASSTTPPPVPDRIVMVDEKLGTIRTPTDRVRTILTAPVDQAWDAVASSYTMLKINRTIDDRATGQQGNRSFVMSRKFFNRPVSDYFNCGDDPFAGPNANLHPVTASIVTTVRPEGSGTLVETMVSGTLVKQGASSAQIFCATTGTFESHLAEMIQSRLNR